MAELFREDEVFLCVDWRDRKYQGGSMQICSTRCADIFSVTLTDDIRFQANIWLECTFGGCVFQGSHIKSDVYKLCSFWNVQLEACHADHVQMEQSAVLGCRWKHSSCTNVTFTQCDFLHTELEHMTLQHVIFQNCTFRETFLEQVQFEQVEFIGCQFDRIPTRLMTECRLSECTSLREPVL